MTEIVLYGASGCEKCGEIKDYLISHNISFIYSEVGKDVNIEHLELVVSRRIYELPVITANGTSVPFDYIRQYVEHITNKSTDAEQ